MIPKQLQQWFGYPFLFLLPLLLFSEEKKEEGFFVIGELLYMTAREDGLTYSRPGVSPPTSPTIQKQETSPNLGEAWNFGFKAGLGFVFSHDQWQANITYSRLTTNSSSNIDQSFVPTWDPAGIQSTAEGLLPLFTAGSGHWDLLFNRFNLEIARYFFPSPSISLLPFIGFVATWQKQTLDITYANPLNTYQINTTQSNWGIGLRSGVNAYFNFNDTYGFFASTAIAALWERIRYQRQDNTTLSINEDFHTAKPLIDLSFGLQFNPVTAVRKTHIQGNIGWEMQLWMNESYLQNLAYHGTVGDLILQGFFLTLTAGF